MTHPEGLLADYVDGTLTDKERAVVDAHLAACETCREEVALATEALPALASLPDESVPFGVTGPVLAEARKMAERRQPFLQRYQWAVGLAAAASLVLVAVVLGPKVVPTGSDREASLSSGGAEATTAPAADAILGEASAVALERLDTDYDETAIADLATDTATGAPAVPKIAPSASIEAPDEAVACLERSGAEFGERDQLVRLIEASYLGRPAYIGVIFEGPGAGLPPDRVVVWVVSTRDCRILTLADKSIT
jgi:anti-sigma factor RsiW